MISTHSKHFRLFACFVVVGALISMPTKAYAYVNPVTGDSTARGVTRGFAPPPKPWLAGHRGVDVEAPLGAPILAAEDGVVAFVGVVAGTPVVSIDHPDGIRTTYQPVLGTVQVGADVREGQVIGTLTADTQHSEGLHWGARPGGQQDLYLNPLSLLDAPAIRLKPTRGLV
ncbi:peptidase M23-like protein [Corynebacterium renale]|uniref:Peptidase M23-like protein n=2 Tax=Corynebacterium renale TaxID=1724 RepID=A0A2A9DP20_9CORY|nr:peptidase M23-like protein [Corynebacterium renale]